MGGLAFPAIAKMIMDENQAKVVEKATKTGVATAAETTKEIESQPGALENPNTAFTLLAKLMAMVMVFGTASFMLLVLCRSGNRAVTPSFADGYVPPD